VQEISLNILDVAQNSVSAKASLIEISVVEDSKAHTLQVMIRDNGCGMTEEQVNSVTDPFYTTRTTRRVGLGIPFFKMASEMTGGFFEIRSKVGEGTCVTASFRTDHIDCMPLGEIEETMYSLITMNTETDFLYTARRDETESVTDTREFRTILEGIPFDTPEVAAFIRNYLKENSPFRN